MNSKIALNGLFATPFLLGIIKRIEFVTCRSTSASNRTNWIVD